MLLKYLLIGASLALSFSCKARRELGSSSGLKSLSKEDIDAILNAKETYDQNTEKLLVFVISEDSLTDQGESFFEDFRLLVENHIGSNYKMMILTSGSPAWLYRLGNAGSYPANIILRKDRIGPNDIRALPQAIETWRAQSLKEGAGAKKLQIIFHLLAHGLSATGTGEGGVAIGSEMMSFSEIARDLLTPMAKKSDELIAILEPCYGGNIKWNIPQNFLTANNALLVFGAPPWAPQFAPSSDRPADRSATAQKQARSIASLAVKKALMGFASNMDDERVVQFADEKTLEIFEGTSAAKRLQERHVVRVDEFKNYVQAEGTQLNCEIISEMRAQTITTLCNNGTANPAQLTIGPGLDDEHAEAQRKLLTEAAKDQASFVNYLRTRHPIPTVSVHTPLGLKATLNPTAGAPNAILSVINVVEFERNQEASGDGVGDFANTQRSDLKGTIAQRDDCLKDMTTLAQDLHTVLNWALKPQPSGGSGSLNFPQEPGPGNSIPGPSEGAGTPSNPTDAWNSRPGTGGTPRTSGTPIPGNQMGNSGNFGSTGTTNAKPEVCGRYAAGNSAYGN